jgi:hypothetical protein
MPNADERGTVTKGSTDTSTVGGLAWVSRDGHEWVGTIVYPEFDEAGLEAVAATTSGFVAVGHSGTEDPRAAIWTSKDGKDWYRTEDGPVFAPPPKGGGSNLWSVAVAGDALVTVGREWTIADGSVTSRRAAAWFSSDGTAWRRAESIEDGEGAMFNTVVAAGHGWIAGGVAAKSGLAAIWTSADGNHWKAADSSAFSRGAVQSVVRGGPGFVAVGLVIDGGRGIPAAWTSSDGSAWRRVQSGAFTPGGGISSVTNDGNGLVAIGYLIDGGAWQGTVWTSTDGVAWAQSPAIPALAGDPIGAISTGPLSIASAGSTLVAVGATVANPAAIWARFQAE